MSATLFLLREPPIFLSVGPRRLESESPRVAARQRSSKPERWERQIEPSAGFGCSRSEPDPDPDPGSDAFETGRPPTDMKAKRQPAGSLGGLPHAS